MLEDDNSTKRSTPAVTICEFKHKVFYSVFVLEIDKNNFLTNWKHFSMLYMIVQYDALLFCFFESFR